MPFNDFTFEIVRHEGEDDTLESWQRGHKKYFEEEGKLLGYTFSSDLLVVFENFEKVYE
jgi:uncharacterized protein YhfF